MNTTALVQVSTALADPTMQRQFHALLPADIPVDRFTEVVQMAIRQNPELLDADRQSLYDSCLQSARRALLPDKKEGVLVTFNTKEGNNWVKRVQFMPMVEGIIKELGKVGVRAYANSVYEKDQVRIWSDDEGQHVTHEQNSFGDRGARIGAFAAAKMSDGRTFVEAMNMADLERVALRSKQAKKDQNKNPIGRGGTWASDPERMEQKSCLHRLRKRIPILESLPEDESDFDPSVKLDEPQQPMSGKEFNDMHAELTEKAEKRRPRALQGVIDAVQARPADEPPDDPEPPQYDGNDII